ncbi:tripartite tricarboxylate transporter substrate binding protein [Variovorax terrae]|uniref:Tripartite tricarboxylate transporter substrate binding protein n=1 Tax=Variovorax terrae TaxID=2923278 RepID=A0A9X1VU79_9BURK|nr:tripartite tricarboxylate transporter substrate binding protein [Variovorax terrae]MCJ0763315.1 tripartite tricarboxylate transporter substrate binding protein [Variovorax terrae]
MTPISRRRLVGAALAAAASQAWAQKAGGWPDRPIKLLIGYQTGGATDGVMRPLEPRLQAALGQPLIFDYRPGAGATVAAGLTAKAPADGYTIHITDSGPMTILPNGKQLSYDPTSAFTPLGMICEGCSVIAVHPSVPAKNLADLVKMAKARPGSLTYGTSGIGGSAHLSGELFQAMTGTELVHVPYKGGSPAAVDLVGGQIPMLFASTGTALPFIQSGKMRALAVTSASRSSVLPEVPTVAEQGYPGYDATVWFALVGPARMPADASSRVHRALQGALADPAVEQALRRQGYEPILGPADVMQARVRTDLAKWGKLIRERKISFE